MTQIKLKAELAELAELYDCQDIIRDLERGVIDTSALQTLKSYVAKRINELENIRAKAYETRLSTNNPSKQN
jgi:hypothetical protein